MPASPTIAEAPAAPQRGAGRAGAGLYIHWPFCAAKCPYCDFNSHVRERVDEARWVRALSAEIAHYAAHYPELTVASIFFGGGTPSLMSPGAAGDLLAAVDRHFGLADGVEITLEANPSTVEAARFAGFHAAGINRVSIGVQSLRDDALGFLGRTHSAAAARKAVAVALARFDRVSIDLIYARPGQRPADWSAELDEALALGTGHLSAYQLTIEPGTRFHRDVAAGRLAPLDGDSAADLYQVTQERCTAAGLRAYEISNHARPGAECRHNLVYWRSRPYLGIGPGAHGRLPAGTSAGVSAQVNIRSPEKWLAAAEATGAGLAGADPVPARARAEEIVMMGLRLAEGLDLAELERQTGLGRDAVIAPGAVAALSDAGLIAGTADRLVVLPAGRLLLDSILGELLG